MIFNEILGAGAQPRSIRNIEAFSISSSMGGTGALDTSQTVSIAPTYGEGNLFAVSLTVVSQNSNGTTSTATAPTLQIYVNDALISQYSLNNSCGDALDWRINDIIPYSYSVYGGGNLLKVRLTASGTGGNGYSIRVNASAHVSPTF